MVDPPVPPAILEDDRWELVDESAETIGRYRLVTVDSERATYGDREVREAVRDAVGVDAQWRTFFAARLTTSPPLSRSTADLVVRSIAVPQARRRFATDLRDRGFRGVGRAETTRLRIGSGKRAHATRFDAAISIDANEVGVHAWLAVWNRETDVLAGGGTYPVESLPGAEPFASPGEYRAELFELIRAVGSS